MFAFQLRRGTSTQSFRTALTQLPPIYDIQNWNQFTEIFQQFYAIGHRDGNFAYVYQKDDGEIVVTNLYGLKERLSSVYVKIDIEFAEKELGVFIKPPKKKKTRSFKKERVIADVTIHTLLTLVPLERIANVYSNIVFKPGSLENKLDPHSISIWRPTDFFFPDPSGKSDHCINFCQYFPLYRQYFNVIHNIAEDPRHDYADHFPELKAISYFFELIFYLSGKNMEIFYYILRWIAHVMYAGEKSEVGLVLVSAVRGIGKSLVCEVLSRLVQSKTCLVGAFLSNSFQGDWIENTQLMILEESEEKQNIKADRNAQISYLDKMKMNLTTKDMMVDLKFRKARSIVNYVNYLFTLNNAPYSLIETGDRRLVVVECDSSIKGIWQKYPTDQQPYHYLKKKLILGDNNEEWHFLTDEKIKNQKCYSCIDLPNCTCPQDTSVKPHYGLAFLALVFLEIYQLSKFTPFSKPPLTEYHFKLQIEKSAEYRVASEFCFLGSNIAWMPNVSGFSCDAPGCNLPKEKHFDPENPHWMMVHYPLDSYMAQKKYDIDKPAWETLGVTLMKTGCLTELYKFPTHQFMMAKIQELLNLSNRDFSFDPKEYFRPISSKVV